MAPSRAAPSLRDVTLVAAGGAIGALSRVALAAAFPVVGSGYPWPTFLENLSGAFILALVLTLLAERFRSDRWVRLLVCTGALGAFTTYSTYADEVATRLLDRHLLLAAGYAVATTCGGIVAGLLGARAGRAWPARSAGDARRPRDGWRP